MYVLIFFLSCLCHIAYTKWKYKNFSRNYHYHENKPVKLNLPYLQNVYINGVHYPLVVFKDKTLLVSEEKGDLPTISQDDL